MTAWLTSTDASKRQTWQAHQRPHVRPDQPARLDVRGDDDARADVGAVADLDAGVEQDADAGAHAGADDRAELRPPGLQPLAADRRPHRRGVERVVAGDRAEA